MTDWMTRNPQINHSPNLLGHLEKNLKKLKKFEKKIKNRTENAKIFWDDPLSTEGARSPGSPFLI
jgi:hypothetical protein